MLVARFGSRIWCRLLHQDHHLLHMVKLLVKHNKLFNLLIAMLLLIIVMFCR